LPVGKPKIVEEIEMSTNINKEKLEMCTNINKEKLEMSTNKEDEDPNNVQKILASH
jgi:hypothetical protein